MAQSKESPDEAKQDEIIFNIGDTWVLDTYDRDIIYFCEATMREHTMSFPKMRGRQKIFAST